MLQLLADWQRKPLVEALMAFKGFKLVAAMVTVSEIGTFSRFEHPKKLMAFLGLVPSENSSGKSRKQGGISKCGNPHARWLLVEQATHYRVPPKISPQLSERQRNTPRWIKELSWKTQTRLSHRFAMLRKRGMHHNKIKVAIARELTGFVWELGTRFESQTQPQSEHTTPPSLFQNPRRPLGGLLKHESFRYRQGHPHITPNTHTPTTALQSGMRRASRLRVFH